MDGKTKMWLKQTNKKREHKKIVKMNFHLNYILVKSERCHIYICIYFHKKQIPMEKNESFFYFAIEWPTASLSSRRFKWILCTVRWHSIGLNDDLCAQYIHNTVCIWSEWVGFDWREQMECLHTHIHISTECPFYLLLKDAFFHNFFLQLPFSPSTDSPFFLAVVVVSYYFNNFFFAHSRFSLFCVLLVCQFRCFFLFSFHPRPAIRKVLRTTQLILFFGSQTNKQTKIEWERKRKEEPMLEKVIISVMGKFLCI